MNRRYIDFVPSRSNQRMVKRGQEAVRVTHAVVPKQSSAPKARRKTPRVETVQKRRTIVKKTTTIRAPMVSEHIETTKPPLAHPVTEPALGVVEDLGAKFVRTEVPKRPLSRNSADGLAEVKAKKIKASKTLRSTSNSVEKPVENYQKRTTEATYRPPKTPFINQEKVVKRPLSKNVYQKKIVIPEEEPKGPVTIVSKPEKDAHIGIVVTIIITVVLGAAAGTVAFLLLPK